MRRRQTRGGLPRGISVIVASPSPSTFLKRDPARERPRRMCRYRDHDVGNDEAKRGKRSNVVEQIKRLEPGNRYANRWNDERDRCEDRYGDVRRGVALVGIGRRRMEEAVPAHGEQHPASRVDAGETEREKTDHRPE